MARAAALKAGAANFKALLELLNEQHVLEIKEANKRAEDERQRIIQLNERLAASEGESQRLRRHLRAIEKDPLAALAGSPEKTAQHEEEEEEEQEQEALRAASKESDVPIHPPHPCVVEAPPPPDLGDGGFSPRNKRLPAETAAASAEKETKASNGTAVAEQTASDSMVHVPSGLAQFETEEVVKLREEMEIDEEEQRRLAKMYEDSRRPRILSVTSLGSMASEMKGRAFALRLITNPFFDALIGAIITANAVTIGIETSYAKENLPTPTAVLVLENIFLVIYIFELALRFYAVGLREAIQSSWVKFDSFLVLCGITDVCIRLFMGGGSVEALEKVMLIRMLRLARLARTVRLLMQFRTLWLLVEGLMLSVMTLLWTFVIVVALTYIFAIAGMELIRPDPVYSEEYNVQARLCFTTLADSMLTLVQFFTLDSVGTIYRPMVLERPVLALYFFGFILLMSIALMNLITAIMVEGSLRQANDDIAAKKAWEAQKKKDLLPGMKKMFAALDADGSGELDLEEIQNAPDHLKEQLAHICKMDDLEELFQLLDCDGSGQVDIDDFMDGIMRTNSDKPPELLRLMKQCSDISKRSIAIETQMKRLTDTVESLTKVSLKDNDEWPEPEDREDVAAT